MKKILIAFSIAALLAGSAWAAPAMTPLQLGFFGSQAQLFPAETSVMGLRLNVFCSDNQDVAGFDVGVVGRAARMSDIQVNLVNIVSEEFAGIGVGLFNDVNSLQGIQAGLFNTVAHDVSGFQIGLFNNADSVSGIQVGLFNRTVSMQGLQIGLINLITEGPITFFPIVNFAY